MKITTLLLGTLCLLPLCIPGTVPLEAQQTTSIQIDVTKIQEPTQAQIEIYEENNGNEGYTEPMATVVPSTDQSDDLQIRQTDNTGWSQNGSSLTHSLGANTDTISLRVDCLDYAAYGELVLTASGSGYTSNTVTVQIPEDTNGNKIADSWQNDATLNYGRDDDNDTGPNTRKGDNITVINEYRGYHNNGSWTDTDPNAWDVFVKLDADLVTGGYSISGAYALPMNVHEAPWVSMGDGRVFSHEIARESGAIVNSVYAIRLKADGTIGYSDGDMVGSMSSVGPPTMSSSGTIYVGRLVGQKGDKNTLGVKGAVDIFGVTDVTDYVNAVIAHEIGHGVNLGHCPCFDDLDCYMWNPNDEVYHEVSGFASHHNDDYNLVFDGYFWPRQAADNSHIDRIYVDGVGIRERKVEDVDGDGVVSASDLVIIALNFGISVPHIANVNGDNAVNVLDLVMVANAMTTTGSVCFTSLREDVNGDGVVDVLDMTQVASKIGSNIARTIPEDVDANGSVNKTDLDLVAAAFGNTVATTTTTTTTTTSTTPTPTPQIFDPSLSGNASTYSPGSTLSVTVSTSGAPIYGARLYRSSTDLSGWVSGSKTTTSLDLSYTFPTNATGSYSFTVCVWPWDGDTYGTVEYLYLTGKVQ